MLSRPKSLAYRIALLVLPLLFFYQARAAYIYLDINNNPFERGAYAQQLANEHSYERFITIPHITEDSAHRMISLSKSRDVSWVRYVNEGCLAAESCNSEPVGTCSTLHSAVRGWEDLVSAVPKTKISVEELERQLSRINLAPGEPIQLAISGHYSGGEFTGNLGSITVRDINQAFNGFPRLRAAVTKLHLLGCYTNTLSQIETTWRRPFPNARAIVGFYRQSPVGDDRRNLRFIQFLVKSNQAIDKVRTEKQFSTYMSALNRIGLPAALTIGDWYQVTGGRRVLISESRARGSVCAKNLRVPQRDEFLRIMKGEQPIPEDTSHSGLRTYYTGLRTNLDCLEEPGFKLAQASVPHPDKAIRLIFFRNTLTNFQRLHRSDIANLNTLLQRTGITASLSIQNVNTYDRKDLLAWVDNVRAALKSLDDREAAERALRLVNDFARVIVVLDPYCIPVDWIEPSGFQKSKCFSVPGDCR